MNVFKVLKNNGNIPLWEYVVCDNEEDVISLLKDRKSALARYENELTISKVSVDEVKLNQLTVGDFMRLIGKSI